MINIGIVGGACYIGAEALLLLVQHANAEVVAIASRKDGSGSLGHR